MYSSREIPDWWTRLYAGAHLLWLCFCHFCHFSDHQIMLSTIFTEKFLLQKSTRFIYLRYRRQERKKIIIRTKAYFAICTIRIWLTIGIQWWFNENGSTKNEVSGCLNLRFCLQEFLYYNLIFLKVKAIKLIGNEMEEIKCNYNLNTIVHL